MSGARYLEEAPHDQAMGKWRSAHLEGGEAPLKHTVWTHDFMCLGMHNVACPVCFDRHATLRRDVTPGRYRQQFGPCEVCERQGWRLIRMPRWLLAIAKLFGHA